MNSAKPSGNFTLAQEKRCSKLETGKGNQKDLPHGAEWDALLRERCCYHLDRSCSHCGDT